MLADRIGSATDHPFNIAGQPESRPVKALQHRLERESVTTSDKIEQPENTG